MNTWDQTVVSRLHVLDERSGAERASLPLDLPCLDGGGFRVWGSLTTVYIQAQVCRGAASGAMIALDVDTGAQLWRRDFA
jgi:hypothetical protein